LKPTYADALFALGWSCYSERSDPNGMEAAFRTMAQNNPHDYRGLHGLGYALYLRAVREKDLAQRDTLIAEATQQSQAAKNLSINALHIVMDFGEVARSSNPDVSLYFHEHARKLLKNPKLAELGDNPFSLFARLVMIDDSVVVETPQQKHAWIEYQIALDHLAMHRRGIGNGGELEHLAALKKAKRLDADGLMFKIYSDQLAILDHLLRTN
jgi:hypothetical protein